MATDVTKALLVRIEALPGREADVESFLQTGLSLVQDEPETVRWFAIRFGPSSFGIFDAFPDDEGRQTHLSGPVGQALGQNTGSRSTSSSRSLRRDVRGGSTLCVSERRPRGSCWTGRYPPSSRRARVAARCVVERAACAVATAPVRTSSRMATAAACSSS
jgi:hypothetical protein